MELYKVALVNVLGGRSQHPYRAAAIRLAALSTVALGSSWALAIVVRDIPFAGVANNYRFIPSALLTFEVVTLCGLLAASGVIHRMYKDGFARLLSILPINSFKRWTVLMVPSTLLALLTTLLAAWPLAHVWLSLGLSPQHILGVALVGIICGLGLFHGLPPRLALLRFILVPYVLWIQYTLASTISNPFVSLDITALNTFVAIACILGAAWPFSSHYTHAAITRNTEVRTVRLASLPVSWWHIKKLIRSASIRLSWTTALGLMGALVVADRSLSIGAPTYSLGAAIIVAAFVSDIRALSRLIAPAEITALRGSTYFMAAYMIAACICGVLVVLPLVAYLGSIPTTLMVKVFMGIATGIFAGTLLAPSPRDIFGQFTSGLICIGILAILPAMLNTQTGPALQHILHVGLGICLLIAAWRIEYKRNPFNWRTMTNA